uniref:Uncharacterized protein n=1 Tax=Lepeophtheirus salmonis TaxID=72036 RepID=A0A0K2TJD2_LEPSM
MPVSYVLFIALEVSILFLEIPLNHELSNIRSRTQK